MKYRNLAIIPMVLAVLIIVSIPGTSETRALHTSQDVIEMDMDLTPTPLIGNIDSHTPYCERMQQKIDEKWMEDHPYRSGGAYYGLESPYSYPCHSDFVWVDSMGVNYQ